MSGLDRTVDEHVGRTAVDRLEVRCHLYEQELADGKAVVPAAVED